MNRIVGGLLLLLVLLVPLTAYADDTVAIRAYLVDKGYTDDQITYNSTRKMVQLDGRNFYGTWPKEDGITYGIRDSLDELIEKHKKGDYFVILDTPKMMIK